MMLLGLYRLSEEMRQTRADLRADFANLRADFEAYSSGITSKLEVIDRKLTSLCTDAREFYKETRTSFARHNGRKR